MEDVNKMSIEQVEFELKSLKGWEVTSSEEIVKVFLFPDFGKAFYFMTQVAQRAEELNHHPEWTNVYGRVMVKLATHSQAGLTELDFRLAAFMDEVAAPLL